MPHDAVLSEHEVVARLADHPRWELRAGKLHRDLTFGDFGEAFAFMARVALAAEKLDHHPDWSNSWNQVVIDIVNHQAGGVTQRCFDLAAAADRAAGPR